MNVLRSFTPYLANLLVIWLAVFFYQTHSYYASFLRDETQLVIFYLAVAYTAGGLLYYLLTLREERKPSKGLLILRGFAKLVRSIPSFFQGEHMPAKEERVAILFGLVKLFFLPLMLNFFFGNFGDVQNNFSALVQSGEFFSIHSFNSYIFPLAIALIFTIDTLYFAFGYTFEASFLDNAVRSVEPTVLGWVVTLVSYPPFNGFITVYLLWYANDFLTFESDIATVGLRLAILFFLIIYVWASVALGAKCSNLTNRGIVHRFPYSLIRHPAYAAKNISWWLTVIPLLNPIAYASMFGWSFIYYLRAVTEERHLMQDPDYQTYVKKVRWKFIPGIW